MQSFKTYTQSGILAVLLGTAALTGQAQANERHTFWDSVTGNTDIDWSAEDQYWSRNYSSRDYYRDGRGYDSYQSAYMFGVRAYYRYMGEPFRDVDESALRQEWERTYGRTGMDWNEARGPVMDAYTRLYNNRNVANRDADRDEYHPNNRTQRNRY